MTTRNLHLSGIAGALVIAAACGRSVPSVEEAQAYLTKTHSTGSGSRGTFSCATGQGDYHYICQARYEPPTGTTGGVTVQRVGVKYGGTLGGEPTFVVTVLPNDGSVPTTEALVIQRKAEADAAAERAKARINAATGAR